MSGQGRPAQPLWRPLHDAWIAVASACSATQQRRHWKQLHSVCVARLQRLLLCNTWSAWSSLLQECRYELSVHWPDIREMAPQRLVHSSRLQWGHALLSLGLAAILCFLAQGRRGTRQQAARSPPYAPCPGSLDTTTCFKQADAGQCCTMAAARGWADGAACVGCPGCRT